jgi:hypothetical protein
MKMFRSQRGIFCSSADAAETKIDSNKNRAKRRNSVNHYGVEFLGIAILTPTYRQP